MTDDVEVPNINIAKTTYQSPKVTKMGSIIGHRIDYNGVGALRGQQHTPSKNLTHESPPPNPAIPLGNRNPQMIYFSCFRIAPVILCTVTVKAREQNKLSNYNLS